MSIESSRSIHVVACVRTSFLSRLNNIPLYVCITFCWHVPLRWTLGLPQPFGYIVNNTTMNMSMQISVPIFFQFFWVCTEKWNAGSYGVSVFNLCVCNGSIVSHSGCTILHPDQQYTSFNSSTPSPNAVFVFFITAILMGVRRCLLWSLHFPNGRCQASFHMLAGHLHIIFGEMFIQVHWPIV